MGTACTHGLMNQPIRETGKIINSVDLANTNGIMAASTSVSGQII